MLFTKGKIILFYYVMLKGATDTTEEEDKRLLQGKVFSRHQVMYWDHFALQSVIQYVQVVVTKPKILNRTILSNLVHVT